MKNPKWKKRNHGKKPLFIGNWGKIEIWEFEEKKNVMKEGIGKGWRKRTNYTKRLVETRLWTLASFWFWGLGLGNRKERNTYLKRESTITRKYLMLLFLHIYPVGPNRFTDTRKKICNFFLFVISNLVNFWYSFLKASFLIPYLKCQQKFLISFKLCGVLVKYVDFLWHCLYGMLLDILFPRH